MDETLNTGVIHIQNMKSINAYSQESTAESNLQLEDEQGNIKQLSSIFGFLF